MRRLKNGQELYQRDSPSVENHYRDMHVGQLGAWGSRGAE